MLVSEKVLRKHKNLIFVMITVLTVTVSFFEFNFLKFKIMERYLQYNLSEEEKE